VDTSQLADFLRRRRESLEPADVGLLSGVRRRTPGLRREEVAALAGMSTDYYARLEQQRASQPSVSIVTALARALRLTHDESDHLWRLAGHVPPPKLAPSEHVSPALLQILDLLDDTPAMVITDLEEVLVQNRMAVALLGETPAASGASRSFIWRWFLEPGVRALYPAADHDFHSRVLVSELRSAATRRGNDASSSRLLRELLAGSAEFAELWERHDVAVIHALVKRIVHPELGVVEVECVRLVAENEAQVLLLFTAPHGSESAEQLRLLSVIGTQRLAGEVAQE
jgi:transcriptional regulator with XRE-family HTH domain